MRPHRRQPTRLFRPWDSPGKSTGAGCHFLLQCMKVKSESEVTSVVSDSLRPHGPQPTRLLHAWGFPGKSTGVGRHCLLQHWVLVPDLVYFALLDNTEGKWRVTWTSPNLSSTFQHFSWNFCFLALLFSRQKLHGERFSPFRKCSYYGIHPSIWFIPVSSNRASIVFPSAITEEMTWSHILHSEHQTAPRKSLVSEIWMLSLT